MPQTNKREGGEDQGREAKRRRTTLNEIADGYVCPITMELPLDPVMAEDGRIYERSAIEELIQRQGDALRSPITNEPMGLRLIPAIQARNAIELLVKSGTLNGDEARLWQQHFEDEDHVNKMKKKAEEGNSEAMYNMGRYYAHGKYGLLPNPVKAYKWYRMAADQQYAPGLAAAGHYLWKGRGVETNESEALILIGMGAHGGSAVSAYCLGYLYSEGLSGLPKNKDIAKSWLIKAVDGVSSWRKFNDLDDIAKGKAMNLLKRIESA